MDIKKITIRTNILLQKADMMELTIEDEYELEFLCSILEILS